MVPGMGWRIGSAAVLALVVFGCSGGSEPAAPPLPPPPPPQPPQVVSAAPAASAPRKKPAEKPKPKATVEVEIPNLYVVGEAVPNFTARKPLRPLTEQGYAALVPVAGASTSQFVAAGQSRPQPRTTVHPELVLPEGFTAVESAGVNAQGVPLRIRCTLDDAEMAFVPSGGFFMGIDGQAPECGPLHPVYVDGFYIDVQEVTLKQYLKFREQTISTRRPAQPLNQFDTPEYPAVGMSWRDAQNYAHWAGKELPTEAEWEKAARGTEGFEYPWGNGRPIWEGNRQPGELEPVGKHPNDRSVYGVLDMAGNAREWCSDWYAPDTYVQQRTPDGSPRRNPQGAEKSQPANARVVKGAGSKGWQLWARSAVLMRDQSPNVGIRCVLRIKLPGEEAAETPVAAPANE